VSPTSAPTPDLHTEKSDWYGWIKDNCGGDCNTDAAKIGEWIVDTWVEAEGPDGGDARGHMGVPSSAAGITDAASEPNYQWMVEEYRNDNGTSICTCFGKDANAEDDDCRAVFNAGDWGGGMIYGINAEGSGSSGTCWEVSGSGSGISNNATEISAWSNWISGACTGHCTNTTIINNTTETKRIATWIVETWTKPHGPTDSNDGTTMNSGNVVTDFNNAGYTNARAGASNTTLCACLGDPGTPAARYELHGSDICRNMMNGGGWGGHFIYGYHTEGAQRTGGGDCS
jgi:hypothetical protein